MLGTIVDNFHKKGLKILIEVDPSGLTHFYYEKGNKQYLLKEIRNNNYSNQFILHPCSVGTKFSEDCIVYLKHEKGKIKAKF